MAGQLWRVVNLYRVITLTYAAILVVRDDRAYSHPAGGLIMLAVMTGWTAATFLAYRRPAGRVPWMIVTDVLVAAALVTCAMTARGSRTAGWPRRRPKDGSASPTPSSDGSATPAARRV